MLVAEGAKVRKGDLVADDRRLGAACDAEQQQSQAEAAKALLRGTQGGAAAGEPRGRGGAGRQRRAPRSRTREDQLAKQQHSYAIEAEIGEPRRLDNARNAEKIAATNLEVVKKQYSLTKAGAWVYDIHNQERQYAALSKAYAASAALLGKYTIRAPTDGVVRSIQAAVGSYVSPQGAYDSYTRA